MMIVIIWSFDCDHLKMPGSLAISRLRILNVHFHVICFILAQESLWRHKDVTMLKTPWHLSRVKSHASTTVTCSTYLLIIVSQAMFVSHVAVSLQAVLYHFISIMSLLGQLSFLFMWRWKGGGNGVVKSTSCSPP